MVVETYGPAYVMHHILPAVRLLHHRHYQVMPEVDLRIKKKRERFWRKRKIPVYPHGDDMMVPLDVVETTLLRELPGIQSI